MEKIESRSVFEIAVDTFFLYLTSFILGSITVWIGLDIMLSGPNSAQAGVAFLPILILVIPALLVASIIYFIILRILFGKINPSRKAKYIFYSCIAVIIIAAIIYLWWASYQAGYR